MVEDRTSAARGHCGDGFRLYAEIYALRLAEADHDPVVLTPDDLLVDLLPAVAPEVPR